MSLYLLAEAGSLMMTGATLGSVFPGASASPPIMPTLPWNVPMRNAPEPERFVPLVASRSLPGLLGRDPIMRESGVGSEAMGLDTAEGTGPLTPGQTYLLEGPLDPHMPTGAAMSSVVNGLSGGGAWHVTSATSPSGSGFIIHAVYTGGPVADLSLPQGWILQPMAGFEISAPPPRTPPASVTPTPLIAFHPPPRPMSAPTPITMAQPPQRAPMTQDTAPTPTSSGGGGGGDTGGIPPWAIAGGVVLGLLYFGRKKKRGR